MSESAPDPTQVQAPGVDKPEAESTTPEDHKTAPTQTAETASPETSDKATESAVIVR